MKGRRRRRREGESGDEQMGKAQRDHVGLEMRGLCLFLDSESGLCMQGGFTVPSRPLDNA